jgi:hypothetical protein
VLWVKYLLGELKLRRKGPLRVWCDNQSAISIANNPVQHDRTKHIEIDRFFIRRNLMLESSALHMSTLDNRLLIV